MISKRLFQRSSRKRAPQVPAGERIYAVGDIHGRADLLLRLRDLIADDLAQRPGAASRTILLGDYIDRDEQSKTVLDLLTSASFPTPLVCLKGNHEAMMLAFLAEGDGGGLANGGRETLLSYGIVVVTRTAGLDEAKQLRASLPPEHLRFLSTLPLSVTVGDYFFCHAGARPGVPLEQQSDMDLLWIRDEFLTSRQDFGKVVVHGHTPGEEPEVHPNRINIDTGAFISGRLTCLVLEGSEQRFLVARRGI